MKPSRATLSTTRTDCGQRFDHVCAGATLNHIKTQSTAVPLFHMPCSTITAARSQPQPGVICAAEMEETPSPNASSACFDPSIRDSMTNRFCLTVCRACCATSRSLLLAYCEIATLKVCASYERRRSRSCGPVDPRRVHLRAISMS